MGVDVGGTFTDLICVTPDNEVVLDKTPTTLEDQSIGVMNGLGQLAERFGVTLEQFCDQLDTLVHGTVGDSRRALTVRLPGGTGVAAGQALTLVAPPGRLHLFDALSGARL